MFQQIQQVGNLVATDVAPYPELAIPNSTPELIS
jgi:hypothetical protein